MITLTIPMPPSANRLWRVTRSGRVYRDPKYNEWATSAGWHINRQRPGKINGPFKVAISVPEKARKDVDNLVKPIVDVLVKMAVVDDDKAMRAVSIRRDPAAAAAHIIVEAA